MKRQTRTRSESTQWKKESDPVEYLGTAIYNDIVPPGNGQKGIKSFSSTSRMLKQEDESGR